jgi:cytochrome c556
MKIRSLLFTLVCALAIGSGLRAAEAETELGDKMDKIGGAFRALRKQVADPAKNQSSLEKIAIIRENAQAALKLEPAKKAELPADQQAKFVADYQAEMKKFLAMTDKLEAALKANNNEEAGKILASMGDHQKQSHKSFKKDDKKKT